MKIVICASIDATMDIKEAAESLKRLGHEVEIPKYSQKILNNEITLEKFLEVKEREGDMVFRKKEEDLIMRYYNIIKSSDAILVLNVDKKGIKNYIGGNTFLEMGFAYVLGKKMFLINGIPEMQYKDEIMAMSPTIINGDLGKIR